MFEIPDYFDFRDRSRREDSNKPRKLVRRVHYIAIDGENNVSGFNPCFGCGVIIGEADGDGALAGAPGAEPPASA